MTPEEEAAAKAAADKAAADKAAADKAASDQHAVVAGMVATELGKVLAPVLTSIKDLPGMVKRHANEAVEALLPKLAEQITGKMTPGTPPEELQKLNTALEAANKRVVALEQENAARTTATILEKKENKVLNVVGGVKFLKSAQKYAVAELTQAVQHREKDGKVEFFMTINTRLPDSGQIIAKEVEVEEGVKNWLQEHGDIIQADVRGGNPPSLRPPPGGGEVTFQQLLDDPAQMTDYVRNHPQELTRLRSAYEKERNKK